MKKIFLHIFITALAAFSAISCTSFSEQGLPGSKADTSFPEDATLTMGFCVPTGVATKGLTDMAVDPYIESLHVFFFDEDGTLLQVRQAELSTTSTIVENYNPSSPNEATMLSYWTVDKVNMTVEKRIVHLVANLPANKVPRSGSENSIFRNLSVAYPIAAYWQRLELDSIEPYAYDGTATYNYLDPDGIIQAAPVPDYDSSNKCYVDAQGATVNKGDYIDANGNKIVNGTGYYFIPPADSPLRTSIPLIRNFVSITVNNSWNDFELRKIALVNTPKEGLVAPFRSSSAPKFETAYTWSSSWTAGQVPLRQDLADHGYAPMLAAAGLDSGPSPAGLDVAQPVTGGQTATLFMYERGIPFDNNAVSVLIGGVLSGADAAHKDGDGLTWFKMEITDADGEYYPFYRDLTYTLELTGIVDAVANGHPSATHALNHVALGNISNAKETETLTQINDGNGLTLWVSYIDYTTTGGGTTVPLLYTFFHDSGSTKTYYDNRVTFTAKTNEATGSNLRWATSDVITKEGAVTSDSPYWDKRPDPALTWYLATVTLNSSSTEILQNDIEVVGKTLSSDPAGARRLSRIVTYTVTHPQKLKLEITPIGKNEADRPTHLTVTLPKTITRSSFPLKIRIEAEETNLTPIDNVTAKVGLSTFDPIAPATTQTKNSYYFVKTIEYNEYVATDTKEFMFDFVTTKATTRTAPLVTRVKVTEDKEPGEEHLFLYDDANATCELQVYENVAVTGIHLNHNTVWLEKTGTNNTVQLKAFVEPWEASNVGYTWTNSNPGVATLNTSNGWVTAVDYGSTTITATSEDGDYTASCTVWVYNPVTSIELDHTSLSIPRGSTGALNATVTPSSGAGVHPDVTWTSSNPEVATVDGSGEITALAAGQTIITASATDGSGQYATCEVNVFIPVENVTLNKTTTTIRHNWTEVLRATVSPNDASDKVVVWSSSDPAVATVSINGTVTAVTPSGTAVIRATSQENSEIYAECTVTTLPNPVTGISLNKTSTTIARWAEETLVATVTPSDASNTGIDWTSDDPSIATVDASGKVRAVCTLEGSHTTTIRATSQDGSGSQATCEVTVTYTPVESVSLNKASTRIALNVTDPTETLTATVNPTTASNQTVHWNSDKPSIATVDANGKVTAVAVGTATITATADDATANPEPATCVVEVYNAVTGISLNKTSTSIYVKCTETLTATIAPTSATDKSITWSSSDESVATVADGVVTAVAAGTATITATANDNTNGTISASCTVTVSGTVTFNTNTSSSGDYTNNNSATTTKTRGAVNLVFSQRFNATNNGYVETCYNTPSSFTISGSNSAVRIKSITITYTANNRNGGTSSTSDPVTTSGTIDGGSGTTGTWTGYSNSVTVTLYRESGTNGNRPRISSIVVVYE